MNGYEKMAARWKRDKEESRTVYGLRHPTTKQIFYVGETRNTKSRLTTHITNARHGDPQNAANSLWIARLLLMRLRPELIVLEIVIGKDVSTRQEIFWINKLKNEGHPLTNEFKTGRLFMPPKKRRKGYDPIKSYAELRQKKNGRPRKDLATA